MSNRLINEQSPYLLQHAHNPVDWYPWGPEAFATAQRLNKPIFLSVGYATCHWCHVMAHESFEHPAAAAALNEAFVCIKVDREERPDIDAVYMAACHLLNGNGGWPLTVVMTPQRQPFFAATYLPRESRFGRLGVIDLARRITTISRSDPQRISAGAAAITRHLQSAFRYESDPNGRVDTAILDQAAHSIAENFDREYGGFEKAPKFPMPHRLLFLLHTFERTGDRGLLQMVTQTLTAMRLGGIWDHVGCGFHRYSTDRRWRLPHFEKMLYDQALLAPVYLRAFQHTGDPLLARTVNEMLNYVLNEMTAPSGGFYTAQDADCEGEEGKFYLWTQTAFEQASAGAADDIPWTRIFGLQPEGNFADEATQRRTGANILHLTKTPIAWAQELARPPAELEQAWERLRRRLLAIRAQRAAPLKDDKILTDWNGLMIAALAQAGEELHETRYLEAARKAANFILAELRDTSGRLLHRYRDGRSGITATANDYAFLIKGLLQLARSTATAAWHQEAERLQKTMDRCFTDQAGGGYFLTAADQSDLPLRPKELYDGALPSANAVTLTNLVHLAQLTGRQVWREQAHRLVRAFDATVRRQPDAYTGTLSGWQLLIE